MRSNSLLKIIKNYNDSSSLFVINGRDVDVDIGIPSPKTPVRIPSEMFPD